MKIRTDFVTNSSSSSFVIVKADIPEEKVEYIENNFHWIDSESLYDDCSSGDVDEIYFLVDYNEKDTIMHIWVRRDECMYDEDIDNILWDYDRSGEISPKFDYHY